MTMLIRLLAIGMLVHAGTVASADEARGPGAPHHDSSDTPRTSSAQDESLCRSSQAVGFDNVQIETTDIRLHERLFEEVLGASVVQRLDHPQTDRIRIYCYRHVLVVIRQDLRTPRPTGWVQLNFTVENAARVQQELESAARASSLAQLSDDERGNIVRFRLKPGVMRGHRKVDRLEVYGPEGFLIGFDQPQ